MQEAAIWYMIISTAGMHLICHHSTAVFTYQSFGVFAQTVHVEKQDTELTFPAGFMQNVSTQG
jgi:hypothetical protein